MEEVESNNRQPQRRQSVLRSGGPKRFSSRQSVGHFLLSASSLFLRSVFTGPFCLFLPLSSSSVL